ncbi:hypothetical protein WMY93_004705 [Mugilogobius chulae]|uniref:Concentrative nucleoside transporter N-terminal domain-containing protein n=1 Tax=Mugilogobius chulae TaxID=88201 RepID=A0AAW0PRX0_9GOBI
MDLEEQHVQKRQMVPQMNLESPSSKDETEDSKEHTKSLLEQKLEELCSSLSPHTQQIKWMVRLIFGAGYVALLIAACVLNFQRATVLLLLTAVVALFWAWDPLWAWLRPRCISIGLSDKLKVGKRKQLWIRWTVLTLLPVPLLVLVGLNTARHGHGSLISFCGLLLLIFLMMIFSKHPFRWNWKTIMCGVCLQFYVALLVTEPLLAETQ